MNLRSKPDGKNRFCHTLNGSGTALARLYVALLETGLREDGSFPSDLSTPTSAKIPLADLLTQLRAALTLCSPRKSTLGSFGGRDSMPCYSVCIPRLRETHRVSFES
jgi:hypothetical protein